MYRVNKKRKGGKKEIERRGSLTEKGKRKEKGKRRGGWREDEDTGARRNAAYGQSIPESVRFRQSSVSVLRRPKLFVDYKWHEVFSETGSFSFLLLLVDGVVH